MKPWETDYEIHYDYSYTEELNHRLRGRFGPKGPRNATHASDLFMCLRKAWLKKKLEVDEDIDDDTILTWLGGLQFEDLVSEGDKQGVMAYCFTCKAASRPPNRQPGEPEQDTCGVCGNRWLVGTPDYVVDGVIHESKQTRKSRRRGPADAPWWIDQIRTYLWMARRGGQTVAPYGALVVNWIMGDYGEKKKGKRPRPPRSALDAFKVVFDVSEDNLSAWENELVRRKSVVEGDKLPDLNGMGDGDERSPAYDWECSSCPVGLAAGCEQYRWDVDGNLVENNLVENNLAEVSND